jgi:hypothetical protein
MLIKTFEHRPDSPKYAQFKDGKFDWMLQSTGLPFRRTFYVKATRQRGNEATRHKGNKA